MLDPQGFLEINGHSLEYVFHAGRGPASPVIVLLYEGLGCVALWRDFPTALAEATGRAPVKNRDEQADIVLAAAAITGLAAFMRAGRLKALGFEEQELLERLDKRFAL